MAMFGAHNGCGLDGSVKEQMLVAGLFRIPWQPSLANFQDGLWLPGNFQADETTLTVKEETF